MVPTIRCQESTRLGSTLQVKNRPILDTFWYKTIPHRIIAMTLSPRARTALLLVITLAAGLRTSAEEAEPIRYRRDMRPILSDACFACHGPDAARARATCGSTAATRPCASARRHTPWSSPATSR